MTAMTGKNVAEVLFQILSLEERRDSESDQGVRGRECVKMQKLNIFVFQIIKEDAVDARFSHHLDH